MSTAKRCTPKPGPSLRPPALAPLARTAKGLPSRLLILDPDLIREVIRERQEQGTDQHDEVWDGVYIVPPLANLPHQGLVAALTGICFHVVTLEGRGQVYPGANISDRRAGWEHQFRAPDVVVVLQGSRAVDCETHLMNGPDCLIEVQSPGDQTEEKIPFYARIGVRELLVIERDSRRLRLYRHDGRELAQVKASSFQGGKWLVSSVVPLAFRRKGQRGGARTEIRRTDAAPGHWTV